MSSPNSGDANSASRACIQFDVAAQRVDLAVVRDEAVRVRAVPGRERVRGEARVHERERARRSSGRAGRGRTPGSARAAAGPCRRSSATRGSGCRSARTRGRPDVAHQVLDALADHVELALERVLVRRVLAARRRRPGGSPGIDSRATGPGALLVDRHVAPAEDRLALLADRPSRRCARTRSAGSPSRGQEHHADAVLAGGGQRDAERLRLAAEERVRDLDEDAGAVAGLRIAAAGAAVRQVREDLRPCSTMACERSPFMLATKPTPQASCSMRRVVKPLVRRVVPCYALRKCPLLRDRPPRAPRVRRRHACGRWRLAARAARARCASTARPSSRCARRPRSSGSG